MDAIIVVHGIRDGRSGIEEHGVTIVVVLELGRRFGSGFWTGAAEAARVGWSTEKVSRIRLMVPGRPLILVSWEHSFSAARFQMMSVEWLRLVPGASSSSILLEKTYKPTKKKIHERGGAYSQGGGLGESKQR